MNLHNVIPIEEIKLKEMWRSNFDIPYPNKKINAMILSEKEFLKDVDFSIFSASS